MPRTIVAATPARSKAADKMLVTGLRDTREGLIKASEGCYWLLEDQGWLDLGYDNLRDYLARPEVGLSRTVFYDLAAIHQRYVVDGGVSQKRLASSEHSKLAIPLAAIALGKVTASEAATDAENLSSRALKAKYTESRRAKATTRGVCPTCKRAL